MTVKAGNSWRWETTYAKGKTAGMGRWSSWHVERKADDEKY